MSKQEDDPLSVLPEKIEVICHEIAIDLRDMVEAGEFDVECYTIEGTLRRFALLLLAGRDGG